MDSQVDQRRDRPPRRPPARGIFTSSARKATAERHPIRAWLGRLLTDGWPGLLVLGVYLITLAPTVTGEDSGELLTAARSRRFLQIV